MNVRRFGAALMHGPSPSEYWMLSTLRDEVRGGHDGVRAVCLQQGETGSVGARDGPDREARQPGSGCPREPSRPVASLDSERQALREIVVRDPRSPTAVRRCPIRRPSSASLPLRLTGGLCPSLLLPAFNTPVRTRARGESG